MLHTPHSASRYDCGSKLGHLQVNVEYGLRDEEINKSFSDYLIH